MYVYIFHSHTSCPDSKQHLYWVGHRSPAKRICRILDVCQTRLTRRKDNSITAFASFKNDREEKGSQWPAESTKFTLCSFVLHSHSANGLGHGRGHSRHG